MYNNELFFETNLINVPSWKLEVQVCFEDLKDKTLQKKILKYPWKSLGSYMTKTRWVRFMEYFTFHLWSIASIASWSMTKKSRTIMTIIRRVFFAVVCYFLHIVVETFLSFNCKCGKSPKILKNSQQNVTWKFLIQNAMTTQNTL